MNKLIILAIVSVSSLFSSVSFAQHIEFDTALVVTASSPKKVLVCGKRIPLWQGSGSARNCEWVKQ